MMTKWESDLLNRIKEVDHMLAEIINDEPSGVVTEDAIKVLRELNYSLSDKLYTFEEWAR